MPGQDCLDQKVTLLSSDRVKKETNALLIELLEYGCINLFLAHFASLYLLKTPENQAFSCVFRRCEMATLARNRLMKVKLIGASQTNKAGTLIKEVFKKNYEAKFLIFLLSCR